MSKKKNYNAGLTDGIKFSEKAINLTTQELELIKKDIELISDWTEEEKVIINQIIDSQENFEIEKLFKIIKRNDVNDLETEEKILLLRLLNSLCKEPNENQIKFRNNLFGYCNKNEFSLSDTIDDNFDVSIIENVDSITAQKIMLSITKQYIILGDKDSPNNIDDYFVISNKNRSEIEREIEVLVKLYGTDIFVYQFGDFEVDEDDPDYLNIPEKEYIEVSKDCAQKYFAESSTEGIETSSYVLFLNKDNKIRCLNKVDGKDIETSIKISNTSFNKIIENKAITTYNDSLFIIDDHSLIYYDIDSQIQTDICQLKIFTKEDIEYTFDRNILDKKEHKIYTKVDICNLKTNGKYVLFFNKNFFLLNLETLEITDLQQKHNICPISNQYIIDNNYIYYIDKDKNNHYVYFYKFSFTANFISKISENHIAKESLYINILSMYDNKIFAITEDAYTRSKHGIYVNLEYESPAIHNFFLWTEFIRNFYIYKNYLIYINAKNNFALVNHNMLDDKKKVMEKKCGYKEKLDFSNGLLFGVQDFLEGKGPRLKAEKYKALGKWITIHNKTFNIDD